MEDLVTNSNFWSGKNVLITGHSGFKGSWLAAWLKQMGAKVIGIALAPPTKPSHFVAAKLADGIINLRIDIRDQVALKKSIIFNIGGSKKSIIFNILD